MPKALKVRMDNHWYIKMVARDMNLDLTKVLNDITIAEGNFDMYVVIDTDLIRNNDPIESWYASTFFDYWKFTREEQNYEFVEVEPVKVWTP